MLKVGVLVDSERVPRWAHEMLTEVHRSSYAEVSLFIVNGSQPPSETRKIKKIGERLLYALYIKAEHQIYTPEEDAFEQRHLRDAFSNTEYLTVSVRRTKFSDYISPEDIEYILTKKLDVLIRLGFRILRGDILQAAKHGIWSFHHGDNRVNRGGPPAVWEVINGRRVTGVTLQRLTEELDGGVVLDRHSCHTKPTIAQNKNNLYWSSSYMLPKALKLLYLEGYQSVVDSENIMPSVYSRRLFTTPTNAEMASFGLRQVGKLLKSRATSVLRETKWSLMIGEARDYSTALWRSKEIESPHDRFWADPFVIVRNEQTYIFIEEFIYKENKGVISVLQLDENKRVKDRKVVLERYYHLSYPYLFEYEGELFMAPEAAESKAVTAYRCVRFPSEWVEHCQIMNGVSAYDPTIVKYEGRWWLFVTIKNNEGGSSWDNLHVFHAEHPLSSEWVPHRKNPVVSNVARSRSAGKIFNKDGMLFRPAQDCSAGYGSGIKICRIERLTPTEYAETVVEAVHALWKKNIHGIHTINFCRDQVVFDVRSYKSRIPLFN